MSRRSEKRKRNACLPAYARRDTQHRSRTVLLRRWCLPLAAAAVVVAAVMVLLSIVIISGNSSSIAEGGKQARLSICLCFTCPRGCRRACQPASLRAHFSSNLALASFFAGSSLPKLPPREEQTRNSVTKHTDFASDSLFFTHSTASAGVYLSLDCV